MLVLVPLPLTALEAAAPLPLVVAPTSGANCACGKPCLSSFGETVCPVRRALPMSMGPKSYGIADAPVPGHMLFVLLLLL